MSDESNAMPKKIYDHHFILGACTKCGISWAEPLAHNSKCFVPSDALLAQIESLTRENADLRAGQANDDRDYRTLRAELDAAKETLSAISQYGNDTLSGPMPPTPRDMEWYRLGVIEMRNRARDGWTMPSDTARTRPNTDTSDNDAEKGNG
jgi:hypothetical protein